MTIVKQLKISSIKNVSDDWEKEVWISCISYEDRTKYSITTKLDEKFKAKLGIFIVNKEIEDSIDNDYIDLLKNSEIFERKKWIKVSYNSPTKYITEIYKVLKEFVEEFNSINLTIDISTFPRIELLILLYLIKGLKEKKIVRILYVSVENYGNWLSRGFKKKIVIPFFEGSMEFNKKSLLLIIAGFDQERIRKLIDEIEPNLLVYCQTIGGFRDIFNGRVKEFIDNERKFLINKFEIRDLDAINIISAKNSIQNIINKYQNNFNIQICPSGTKLQLIACFLAYLENPFVQLIYSIPSEYNVDSYSQGSGEFYAFELEF